MTCKHFSVITVTYNAERQISGTAQSLHSQVFGNVEWVVKDGGSTDGTLTLIRQYSPDILDAEPDAGIYDAINKAIQRARGEWVFFLNAGDAFADAHVLFDISAAAAQNPHAEIIYGDVLHFGCQGDRRRRFHWVTRRRLLFGDLCHQAVFVKRELFVRYGLFDSSLRWNADFDWFMRALQAGVRLQYLRRDIARFDDGGAHAQAGARSEAERMLVRARYLPLPLWRLGNLALRLELKLRRLAGQNV
jgi:glycosyltransferase involved in cell wall biosynthesis